MTQHIQKFVSKRRIHERQNKLHVCSLKTTVLIITS